MAPPAAHDRSARPSVASDDQPRRTARSRAWRRATLRSPRSASNGAVAAAGVARTTISSPPAEPSPRGASLPSSAANSSRAAARRRRFTRLRTTAPPTARETTKPTRGAAPAAPDAPRCRTRVGRPARRPARTAVSNSDERRTRLRAGNMTCSAVAACSGGQFGAALTAARSEDGAPRTCTHPQPEAVGLRATPVVRLEGPLAHRETLHIRVTSCGRGQGGTAWVVVTVAMNRRVARRPPSQHRPETIRARCSGCRQAPSRYVPPAQGSIPRSRPRPSPTTAPNGGNPSRPAPAEGVAEPRPAADRQRVDPAEVARSRVIRPRPDEGQPPAAGARRRKG